jgi:hypothetical protein
VIDKQTGYLLPVAFIMGINDGFTGDKIGSFTEYKMMSSHNRFIGKGSGFRVHRSQVKTSRWPRAASLIEKETL